MRERHLTPPQDFSVIYSIRDSRSPAD